MKILFITRNFPPQRGGLERVAFQLYTSLSKRADVILLKWSGSKKWLFLILPVFYIRAIYSLVFKKVDIVYLHDGLLSILPVCLRIFRKPYVITIHGLDITYKNKFYQLVIPRCVSLTDNVVCVSNATKQECVKRGVLPEKINVIPNGLEDKFFMIRDKNELREEFNRKYGIEIKDKKMLLSVSRLVERKGIHWFVSEVLPLIIKDFKSFMYIIAGSGPLAKDIEVIVKSKNLSPWVKLLGKVDDSSLKLIYNAADVFIMPNIPVKGDIEGFGVVALEAASCKLPIVASNTGGIKEALLNGAIGDLMVPLNALSFTKRVLTLLKNEKLRQEKGEKTRKLVLENFKSDIITANYFKVFQEIKERYESTYYK